MYSAIETPSLTFVVICSPLLNAEECLDHDAVEKLQDAQREFIAQTLKENRERNWALCSHSPDVSRLADIAGPHMDRFAGMIYGDKHQPLWQTLERLKGWRRRSFLDMCRAKSWLCPAVAPLWTRGGHYVTGTACEDVLTLKQRTVKYSSSLSEQVKSLPVSSVWGGGKALLRAKFFGIEE